MKSVDRVAAEQGISTFLRALGYDLDDPLFAKTPARVVEAFATELLTGETVDLEALLEEGSNPAPGPSGLVVVRDIRVSTICPHHLLPGLGTALIAYEPGARLVGLGTLARLVDAAARRLTLQESIGERVVRALVGTVGARAAVCRLELVHTCLATRGARQPEARLVTVARAGTFSDPAALEGELRGSGEVRVRAQ
ncbi:MAG TPA: GTP cyclohydrolase I [Polyangiaceae bacterium]|nr:GTP cyclohydrolase I [Polyangiaceae bacterium]